MTVKKFEEWLANSVLGSALKVFLGLVIAAAVANWVEEGTINFDKWQTWVIGALAVATPIVINYINPKDSRYGKKVTE